MRPLTLEERDELVARAGEQDLLDFVHKARSVRRLALLLRRPKPTDIPVITQQRIRQQLASEGTEYTPKEVTMMLESAMCVLRNHLRDNGFSEQQIPSSDVILAKVLHGTGD